VQLARPTTPGQVPYSNPTKNYSNIMLLDYFADVLQRLDDLLEFDPQYIRLWR